MSNLLEIFSKNLRYFRLQKGFRSQEQLAQAANIGIGVIKAAEAKYNLPGYENIEKIAEALEIDPTELFKVQKAVIDPKEMYDLIASSIKQNAAALEVLAEVFPTGEIPDEELPQYSLVKDKAVTTGNPDKDWLIENISAASDSDVRVWRQIIERQLRIRANKSKDGSGSSQAG